MKKTIKPVTPAPDCGQSQIPDLCFVGIFSNQRFHRFGALLLHLESDSRSIGSRAGFSRAQNLTHNGWMAVLFAVIAVLRVHSGTDVFPQGSFSHCNELTTADHGAYC